MQHALARSTRYVFVSPATAGPAESPASKTSTTRSLGRCFAIRSYPYLRAPVDAIKKLLTKTAWSLNHVDLIELNEAFAVQAVAIIRELNLDPEKVNVNGGAVALGHAIGQSGSRILTTMLYELKRRNAHRGIAALCLGGGNAVAMAVER